MMTNIMTQFHEDWIKTVPTREFTCFSENWPYDLVFGPTRPIFGPGLDLR